jgi:polyhydroxybutyrate depolymerase
MADRERLLLVAPEGTRGPDGRRGWNDCRADATTNPATDDVEFLSALVDTLVQEFRIPPRSVFVVGTSSGGQMALRMAIERPALVSAVAAVVAAMPAHSECATPAAPVPVLFMNGTADPLLPYEGGRVGGASGGRGTVLSTTASVAIWTHLAGISSRPEATRFFSMGKGAYGVVSRHIYARDGRPAVVLYRVEGGGHAEPSRSERYPWPSARVVGPQNVMIEMAEEVWSFFSAQVPR